MLTPYGSLSPGTHDLGNIRVVINPTDNGYTESFIVTPTKQFYTIEEFHTLFTDPELTAIYTSTNSAMILARVKMQIISAITLNHPKISALLDRLVTAGIINAARRIEIDNGVVKQ